MTNEIAKANSTALDITNFGGFSAADIRPSSIILIQGNNPLKDKINCSNGDFVADNTNLGTEFEFIPIASKRLLDVFHVDPTQEGGTTKEDYIETVEETTNNIIFHRNPDNTFTEVSIRGIDDEMFPSLFLGSNGKYYQRKIVLIMAINGLPYRFSFKSKAKQMAAKNILETIFKAAKHQKLTDFIEGIFKIFSTEMIGKKGKYYSMSCAFVRKASDDELCQVAAFRNIDITKVKDEEIDPNVPF